MASPDPHGQRPQPAQEPSGVDDALGRLEERLDRASEAAERLLADAAARVIGKPPPAGWQQASRSGGARGGDGDADGAGDVDGGGGGDAGSLLGADADLLLGVLGALRNRVPPELQQRLAEAFREVLLALRALIDWYLERSERQRSEPSEIQDIPIL
jgi:hypothetical protein